MIRLRSITNSFSLVKQKSIFPALKISFIYFIISFLWIFFSDKLLELVTENLTNYSNFQTIKGIGFITITTILIFYLIFRELKEKNAIIEAINESEQWYNILFSNIPNVDVFLFDEDLNYILAQGTGMRNNIINPAEIQGKNLRELKFDRAFVNLLKGYYTKILQGQHLKEEIKYNKTWYELRGAPLFDEHNRIFAGVSLFINITEYKEHIYEIEQRREEFKKLYNEYQRINQQLQLNNIELSEANKRIKESEEKYRAFIKQTNEGIYRFEIDEPINIHLEKDKQVEIIYENAYLAECNEAFARIYELRKENLVNIKLKDFHKIVQSSMGKGFVEKFVENGYNLRNEESEEKSQSGKNIILSKNITGIIINEKLTSAWGTQSDITKRKEYEKKILSAKQKAEENDKLKSAFLANMSHEIRTPLNGILGFSYLLSQENLNKEQKKKFADIIKTNGKQLLNLINDILDISKLEAKQLKIFESDFHLNKLLKEVETLYLNEINLSKKDIKIKVQSEIPTKDDLIKADRERLMQLLHNFISNAIKFTSKGEIIVGCTRKNSELEFYVQDTGTGIPEKEKEQIFNRFHRDESPGKKQVRGTGLGLSISKGLLEIMGGKIWLESEEGKGSTFYFTIPYQPVAQNTNTTREKSLEGNFENKTILIVEDDKNSYDLLYNYMKKYNCQLIHAEDGNKALEVIREKAEIDLVLMDLRLPEMDGYQTTREIKKIRKDVPVIAQSAYAMGEDRKKSFEAGCIDFIAKPIEEKKYIKLISKYLD